MKAKAVLLSVFTTLSNEEVKRLIELTLNMQSSIDIDRVLISDSTYVNDIDCNNNYNSLLTCNVPDMTLHELSFITSSLREIEDD